MFKTQKIPHELLVQGDSTQLTTLALKPYDFHLSFFQENAVNSEQGLSKKIILKMAIPNTMPGHSGDSLIKHRNLSIPFLHQTA